MKEQEKDMAQDMVGAAEEKSSSRYPPYCYIYSNSLYFNTAFSSTAPCSDVRQCVCIPCTKDGVCPGQLTCGGDKMCSDCGGVNFRCSDGERCIHGWSGTPPAIPPPYHPPNHLPYPTQSYPAPEPLLPCTSGVRVWSSVGTGTGTGGGGVVV